MAQMSSIRIQGLNISNTQILHDNCGTRCQPSHPGCTNGARSCTPLPPIFTRTTHFLHMSSVETKTRKTMLYFFEGTFVFSSWVAQESSYTTTPNFLFTILKWTTTRSSTLIMQSHIPSSNEPQQMPNDLTPSAPTP